MSYPLPIRYAPVMVFHTGIDQGWPIERIEHIHRMVLPSGEAIRGLGSRGWKLAHFAACRVRVDWRPCRPGSGAGASPGTRCYWPTESRYRVNQGRSACCLGRDGSARHDRGVCWRTTVPDDAAGRPADLVECDFRTPVPNWVWVPDLTYVRTRSGHAYVAISVDAFSRYIVRWQASRARRTGLALAALDQRSGHETRTTDSSTTQTAGCSTSRSASPSGLLRQGR